MRFFLALWVVVFHQTLEGGPLFGWLSRQSTPVAMLFDTGFVAVGMFYFLSGFILSYNYTRDASWTKPQRNSFAIARFARVYPIYALGLLMAMVPTAYGVIHHTETLGKADFISLTLNWTLLQTWIPRMAMTWNPPGWSLSNEAFFYAGFPILDFLFSRLWRSRTGPLKLLAILGLVLSLVVWMSYMPPHSGATESMKLWKKFLEVNPVIQISAFLMGMFALRVYRSMTVRQPGLSGRGYLLYVPAGVLTVALLTQANHVPYLVVHNAAYVPLFGFIVVGLALGGGWICDVMSHPALVFLGNASYSMYILHAPIFRWITLHISERYLGRIQGFKGFAIYTSAVIVVSCIVFKWVEMPLNAAIKRQFQSRAAKAKTQSAS
ncbi:MAG TPA: acyltransferase [Bryobacteraceae bacterium]|nr:acyltransferase [Bryobacteraceae bacterium]